MSILSSIKHDVHSVSSAVDSHKTDDAIAGAVVGGTAAVAGGAKAVQKLAGPSVTAALSPEEIAAQQAQIAKNLKGAGLTFGEDSAHAAPAIGRGVAEGAESAPK